MLEILEKIFTPPPQYYSRTYENQLLIHLKDIFYGRGRRIISLFLFFKLGSMLFFSYIFYPFCLMLRIFGYRFVNIDIAQLGSVTYFDLFLRLDKLERRTPKNKLIVLGYVSNYGNKYIYTLYDDHVTFVWNPIYKLIFSPFFVSKVFDDNAFDFETVFRRGMKSYWTWRQYEKANLPKYLISIPPDDRAIAESKIQKYIPRGSKHVTLHVRDTGFYGIQSQDTRNGDLNSYAKAVQLLVDRGYYVVRLGNSSAIKAGDSFSRFGDKFFDYAHSDINSELMDIYLISSSEFFIGLSSGPAGVPALFDVPSCHVNWYNPSNCIQFNRCDRTTFKKWRYKATGKLVPFDRIMKEPFVLNPSLDTLEKLDIYLEDNSDEEIYSALLEFLNKRTEEASELQLRAQSLVREDTYAYGALGFYSDTILQVYDDESAL